VTVVFEMIGCVIFGVTAGAASADLPLSCMLSTNAHPLHTRFPNIIGTSISEVTMRPNPKLNGARGPPGPLGRTIPQGFRPLPVDSARHIERELPIGGPPLADRESSPPGHHRSLRLAAHGADAARGRASAITCWCSSDRAQQQLCPMTVCNFERVQWRWAMHDRPAPRARQKLLEAKVEQQVRAARHQRGAACLLAAPPALACLLAPRRLLLSPRHLPSCDNTVFLVFKIRGEIDTCEPERRSTSSPRVVLQRRRVHAITRCGAAGRAAGVPGAEAGLEGGGDLGAEVHVGAREKQIGGPGGSLEPPGPLS
jgi:hypothetical protein